MTGMAPGNLVPRPQYPPFQTPNPQPQPHYGGMGVQARPIMSNMAAQQQQPGGPNNFGAMQMLPQMQQAMGGAMGGGGVQQYPGGGMMRYPGMMSQMGGVRPGMGQVIGQRIMPLPQRTMYEESVTTIPNPSFPRPPGNAVPPYLPASGGVQNSPGKSGTPSPYSTVSMSPGPPIAQGSPSSSLVGHTHLPMAQVC